MLKIARYILTALFLAGGSCLWAQDEWSEWGPTNQETQTGFIVRGGYTLGGTAPIPVPAEIRGINEFSPKGGANIGFDAYHLFNQRWGIGAGWHFFYEGFHTSANVKNYQMSITMDGNSMSGYFTGCDVTNTTLFGMSFPLVATYNISPRWSVSAGPYLSTYFKTTFEGEVYDNKDGVGYLRVDTPTGEKINMDRSNSATYDFAENMRRWGAGVELCVDWKVMRHMNVFANLDWGLANAFDPNFKAVAFKMFPIYATLGVAYRY